MARPLGVAFVEEGSILGGRGRPLELLVVHGVVDSVVDGGRWHFQRWQRGRRRRVGLVWKALMGSNIPAGLLEGRGGKIEGEEGIERSL